MRVTKPVKVEVGLGWACDFYCQWNSLRVSGSRCHLNGKVNSTIVFRKMLTLTLMGNLFYTQISTTFVQSPVPPLCLQP